VTGRLTGPRHTRPHCFTKKNRTQDIDRGSSRSSRTEGDFFQTGAAARVNANTNYNNTGANKERTGAKASSVNYIERDAGTEFGELLSNLPGPTELVRRETVRVNKARAGQGGGVNHAEK